MKIWSHCYPCLRLFGFGLTMILFSWPASFLRAGESLFTRAYTTDTVPEGHFELEQAVRDRFERSFGDYRAFDFISEFEYGITSDLQMALYLRSGYIDAHDAPDDDDPHGVTGFSRNRGFLQSLSTEFIYRLLSPVKNPIGVAFYIEPEFAFNDLHNGLHYDKTMGMEYRVILQKNFLNDTLVAVYNVVAETEFIRFRGESSWAGELDYNNELGLTYRWFSNFYGGLEARNHNEFGDFNHWEHSVVWVGPVIHYGGERFWATLGALRQVYGTPNGTSGEGTYLGDNLFERSHEGWEVTFKVGFPF